jgi:glycerophosphoryl diester phosphodiesterase
MIDGEEVTGWFTEDFTLAELRTLRARERLHEIRPQNARYDGMYQVPTLAEIIALVRAKEAETGRTIGLYPEIKHPTYFAGIGFDLAATLVEQLHAAGYESADAPVFIQCFEVEPLRRLNAMTDLRLVQLVEAEGGPADRRDWLYADLLTDQGLADLAEHVDAIGADLRLVLSTDGSSTGLVERAHAAGLLVHGWTVRKENAFLPAPLQSSQVPSVRGQIEELIGLLDRAGMDGIFTDDPRVAVSVLR